MVKTWSDDNPKAALMSRKRAMIVDAALRAFLENGYAESSVNRIAAEAGVSIKTLYRHFESKDDLFSAVMQAACSTSGAQPVSAQGTAEAEEPGWFNEPPPIALPIAGSEYLRHALSEEQLALYRVVTRDAPRFPELARRYREEVTGTRDSLFTSYLDRWLPVTGWKVRNKFGAAATFAALLKARLFDDALFGVKSPSEEEIAECAGDGAVQMLTLMEAGRL
ncbi:TetR family transcriptional regulator [Paraburkholderia sp. 1N]|uniref:TetR family transcriptional regulator n=1 Tax=Paraburkholderia solitsugae TaxID=2675748 RepID=A0ABX2BNI4_9BURK|nr:TetR/AcrR family transcriptional regulator [Paraburkholderia solitsugae]NPT42321.1 TetR family transcriptional regulator [Paraburkholderia solitsugae]